MLRIEPLKLEFFLTVFVFGSSFRMIVVNLVSDFFKIIKVWRLKIKGELLNRILVENFSLCVGEFFSLFYLKVKTCSERASSFNIHDHIKMFH